jgi:UDP-N-acetylmuramate--alanine ligase
MNKKIHFIGIGGAGMLPLAIHSKLLGHDVTGSDLSSENFHLLEKEGIFPQKGHKGFGTDTELVVYSSAVREDNYEMRLAAEKNIPRVKRAEFTGILTRDSHSVLVAGCHGKSTATVMLADMMNPLPPFFASAIAGAEAVSTESNYFKGTGTHIIIEADEYDRSFLKLFPKDLIVLNIDDDHLDIYKDIEGVKKGFAELAGKLTSGSFLVYNGDDENVRHAVEDSAAKKISFGLDENNDYYAKNIIFDNFRTSFGLYSKNGPVTEINYRYTGMHNVYNMLSCLSLLSAYGISKEALSEAALRFSGLKRRQEIIYSGRDFTLIDEYGHHPTEIKCSLEGVRENSGKRIIVLFQPHLYSRTKYHAGGFAKSFSGADKVFISHIYPAREVCDGTVSSSMIYSAMEEKEKAKTAVFDNFDDLYSELVKTVLPGDLIMSMGAGEINKVLYRLKNEIISRQAEKLSRTVSHFRTNEPMSEHTYYNIGGPARFYAAPENESELISLVSACNEASVEYFILGKGSNILVSDRGFEGCVIDISAQMNKISVSGTKMTVQAGAVMSKLAAEATEALAFRARSPFRNTRNGWRRGCRERGMLRFGNVGYRGRC